MSRRRFDPGWIMVAVASVCLASIYAWLGWWRYSIFRAGVDEAAFTQIGAGLFGGFSSTLEFGLNHLLVHASPILALTYPMIALFRGALGLVLLQAALVAATIFPVYGVARSRLPWPAALAVAVVAAAYPPLSGEAVGDFHELAFAPLLTASFTWAIDARRWRWAIVVALLLVLVKEDMFVGMAFVGGLIALGPGNVPARRRCGAIVAGIGIVAALCYFAVVRPLINPAAPYWSFHFYQWSSFPPTPEGFVSWSSPVRLSYLVDALAPLAFVPLFSRYALFAIPGFLEVMASHEGITYVMGTHYSATWSGYLLCAFADGIGVLWLRSRLVSIYAMFGAALIAYRFNVYDSPMQPGYFLYRSIVPNDRVVDHELRDMATSGSVYTSDALFAHMGENPKASVIFRCQDFVVFDPEIDGDDWRAEQALMKRLVSAGSYRAVDRSNGVLTFKRVAPCKIPN